jgi:hypothetical protein
MTGSGNSPLTVSGHQYYVKLPAPYDASKPYRVLFVFNPTNNPITWAEQSAGFESNAAKDSAIRVYPAPASMASGWGAGDVSFFRPLYDQVIASYCADKARVFATGESSGGDFSSIIGCEHANVLRSVRDQRRWSVPARRFQAKLHRPGQLDRDSRQERFGGRPRQRTEDARLLRGPEPLRGHVGAGARIHGHIVQLRAVPGL